MIRVLDTTDEKFKNGVEDVDRWCNCGELVVGRTSTVVDGGSRITLNLGVLP